MQSMQKSDEQIYKKIRKYMNCLFFILLGVCIIKTIWFLLIFKAGTSFEAEKTDILKRRKYLINQTMIEPQRLLDKMPAAVGEQFQGEWAIYTCSMFCTALTNIAFIFPETQKESIEIVDSLINKVLSPEMRKYDADRWGEDPIESLAGDNSHISYISHLAWMISEYKYLGGGSKFDKLFHALSATMNRRLLASENLCLLTYPGERVYVPDMLVAIASLSNYAKLNNGKYAKTVEQWTKNAKTIFMDEETGLLSSFLTEYGEMLDEDYIKVRGSYSALNCFYLYFIDKKFAAGQFEKVKQLFLQDFLITGFREYRWKDKLGILDFDIDSGPIIMGLSATGTAFAIGSVTFSEDFKLRKKLLYTAELAGSSVQSKNKKHYLLANSALVGEAIVLAMKTATEWDKRYVHH
jgi:hypothetical protein